MIKTVILLFALIFFASGNEAFSNTPVVPTAALNFETDLKLRNFSGEQEVKILEAAELIRKVLTSHEFKEAILNHEFENEKAFYNNDGLSNEEIYQKIIDGAEILQTKKDHTMNLDLTVFHSPENTVGYTYPKTKRVWVNKKYLDKYDSARITTNMMHEWLHKLGFNHDIRKTTHRKYSVPYSVGYIMGKLAAQMN